MASANYLLSLWLWPVPIYAAWWTDFQRHMCVNNLPRFTIPICGWRKPEEFPLFVKSRTCGHRSYVIRDATERHVTGFQPMTSVRYNLARNMTIFSSVYDAFVGVDWLLGVNLAASLRWVQDAPASMARLQHTSSTAARPSLMSFVGQQLVVPRHRPSGLRCDGSTPMVCNSLPDDLRALQNSDCFCRFLKTLLFSQY